MYANGRREYKVQFRRLMNLGAYLAFCSEKVGLQIQHLTYTVLV